MYSVGHLAWEEVVSVKQALHQVPQPLSLLCHCVTHPAILEIVLSPLFIANVLMETFFIVFYSTGEINFQSGFGLSDFPPAQPLESCAGLLPFLAKVSLVP